MSYRDHGPYTVHRHSIGPATAAEGADPLQIAGGIPFGHGEVRILTITYTIGQAGGQDIILAIYNHVNCQLNKEVRGDIVKAAQPEQVTASVPFSHREI